MAPAALKKLVSEIQRLKPEEKAIVMEALRNRDLPEDEEEERVEQFHQALLAAGIISVIKPRRGPREPSPPLIEIKGEPLSETVIRERR